jgi:hypothetical protein
MCIDAQFKCKILAADLNLSVENQISKKKEEGEECKKSKCGEESA